MNPPDPHTSQHEPVIVVDNLVRRFGSNTVLDGISFTVNRGETLVILGRSGTGKSVTLKTIIGLLDPSAGSVSVMGRSLNQLPEQERLHLRKDIGYVFQFAALFDSLSVLENVGFPLYQARVPDDEIAERVHDRLRMVGLAHTMEQMPSELSGGMRKRVGLARAVINDPQVMLYDEPTSGLDPLTTDVINQIILRLRRRMKVTSVVVTHDMGSAFTIGDRIIMLDKGRIVAQGTPEEIQQSSNDWVQHFIHGRALDNESIDITSVSHPRISTLPGAELPAAISGVRTAATVRRRAGSGRQMPPTIRLKRKHRRRRTESGDGETPLENQQLDMPPAETPLSNHALEIVQPDHSHDDGGMSTAGDLSAAYAPIDSTQEPEEAIEKRPSPGSEPLQAIEPKAEDPVRAEEDEREEPSPEDRER